MSLFSILKNCLSLISDICCVSARGPQVFCYMTSWSQKRPGAGKFTPENVDPLLCTHVIYAFATLKDHKLTPADDKDVEMYDRVVALREKNPNLKVRTLSSLYILCKDISKLSQEMNGPFVRNVCFSTHKVLNKNTNDERRF